MTTKRKVKISIIGVIVVLLVIFLFLNREETEVDLIFSKVTMTTASLVICILASGFLLGWLTHSIVAVRQAKKNAATGVDHSSGT